MQLREWLFSEKSLTGRYLKQLFTSNREFILKEVLAVKGLMQLLMKNRNTGEAWTRSELKQLRAHLAHIVLFVPALIIFLLPGGSIMLPILAEALDRRRKARPVSK